MSKVKEHYGVNNQPWLDDDDEECRIVGLIYEMLEECVEHGELDEDYAMWLKKHPREALNWLESNEGLII